LRCCNLAQKHDKKKLAQRRRGAKEERAFLDVPTALLSRFSSSLLLFFYSSLLLFFSSSFFSAPFASLREISFSGLDPNSDHGSDCLRSQAILA
jgi:hypothetical protein